MVAQSLAKLASQYGDDVALAAARASGLIGQKPNNGLNAVRSVATHGNGPRSRNVPHPHLPAGAAREAGSDALEAAAQGAEAIEAGNTWLNMKVLLPLTMGAPLGGWALGKVGQWTGSKSIARLGEHAGNISHVSFSHVGEKLGPVAGITRSATQGAMNLFSPVAGLMEKVGITGALAGSWEKKLASRMQNTHAMASQVFSAGAGAAHPEVSEALGKVKGMFAEGVHKWGEKELGVAASELGTLAARHGHNDLARMAGKLAETADHAHLAHTMAGGWRNLPQNMRNGTAVSHMANGSVLHGVMHASFLVSAAASDVITARDAHKDMKSLVQLAADISGKKKEDISLWTAGTGGYGKVVKQEFWSMVKKFGPSMVLDAANTLVNAKMLVNTKLVSGMAGMFWMIALPLGSQMWRGFMGSDVLPLYDQMKQAQAQKEPLPPEAYAKLVGQTALAANGGEKSNFAQALGAMYAQEQAKVETVMKEVESGRVNQRLEYLKKQYAMQQAHAPQKAQGHAQEHAVSAQHPAGQHQDQHQGVSHVARLNGAGKAAPQRTEKNYAVLGKHTAEEAGRQAGHEVSLSMGA